ncbi:protease complex subunit PrcB family protein [Mediterraneibacter agrestimuris]|uniref:protease complex subunit PrcB family protein n=1 Tax=Mediterraneibacter agrestimuris TaxID=2941333 RepID=UPI00203F43B6|nr:protease complex subunit PrcB family protein [Mediterraneibacter agrestimuris]
MKIILRCLAVFLLLFTLTGCVSRPLKTEKLRDLEFTVLDKLSVPKEFQEIIETNKHERFKLTYADGGELYIAEGYGAQLKTGYSVEVTGMYETENAVYIHTNLLGPEKGEETKEITTFPYVVVKLKYIDKQVVFD